MHSRSSRPHTPPVPHLSEIIKVYPEEEPWCAGFARSQSRRCHLHTNARGRKTAMSLLKEGTGDLRAGEDITDLLEELAPHVLCTRYHKNQAMELAAKWQKRVQRYLNSYIPPAAVRRPKRERRTKNTNPPTLSRQNADASAQYTSLERRRQNRIGEIERIRASISDFAASQARQVNESRARTARSATSGSRPSRRSSARSLETSTFAPDSTETFVRIEEQERLASNFTSRAHTPTESSRSRGGTSSRATRSPTTPSSHPGSATRRPVKGECIICYDSLLNDRSGDDHGSRSDTESEEEQEDEEEEEDDDDDDEEEEEEEKDVDEEVSWCKAQCGTNFHTCCIEKWLQCSSQPTCPNCRSRWSEWHP
ncbi:hypothetical protein BDW62DRAFT_180923 [Aspergillus aurantiobrunneus]